MKENKLEVAKNEIKEKEFTNGRGETFTECVDNSCKKTMDAFKACGNNKALINNFFDKGADMLTGEPTMMMRNMIIEAEAKFKKKAINMAEEAVEELIEKIEESHSNGEPCVELINSLNDSMQKLVDLHNRPSIEKKLDEIDKTYAERRKK